MHSRFMLLNMLRIVTESKRFIIFTDSIIRERAHFISYNTRDITSIFLNEKKKSSHTNLVHPKYYKPLTGKPLFFLIMPISILA